MSQQIGVAQKIGYSFLGLLAGNATSLAVLVLIAILQQQDAFTWIEKILKLDCGSVLLISVVIMIYSMPAWVMVGLPFVLLLPEKVASGFHWVVALPIGALLGASSMLFPACAFNHWQVKLAMLSNPIYQVFLSLAALIAGGAFLVYCALLRQARESGAPLSTPLSIAGFDF